MNQFDKSNKLIRNKEELLKEEMISLKNKIK